MPPKKSSQVFLVVDKKSEDIADGIDHIVGAYTTQQAADAAIEALEDDGAHLDVVPIDVKDSHVGAKKTSKGDQTKTKSGGKATEKTKAQADEDVVMDEDDETSNNKRKKIVEGASDALAGFKLLFTGTFVMDRKTCEASAIKAGATIATTMKQADIIVLGTKPGPKKVTEIEENGYETWNEDEFMSKIQGSDNNGAKKAKTAA